MTDETDEEALDVVTTVLVAIWSDPAIFQGLFEVRADDGRIGAPLWFRCERAEEERSVTFTELVRVPTLANVLSAGVDDDLIELLAVALDTTASLLDGRTLERLIARGVPLLSSAPPELLDVDRSHELGFAVTLPFHADDEASLDLAIRLQTLVGAPVGRG